MAKAEGNGTALGGSSLGEGSSKGGAEGVKQDRGADEENVVKELHEGGVVAKGDTPGVRVFNIHHGRHHLFGLHVTFKESARG